MNNNNEVTTTSILERSVNEIFPSKELVQKILDEKKVTLYMGIDPTGPTLHLGHAIQLMKLAEFQTLGHKVILLIGDFTGMIGDPTDKAETRKKLTCEEVLENATLYKEQAGIFLNFDGDNPAELRYNSEWLNAMNFADVLELASHMTVDQMLKRDMFDKRIQEGKPIFLHEFLYPLLQGYDSVAMDVDGEIGGNDQMFNMLAGRTLMKQIKNKEKFVLTMKLLEDATGKKMGKTEGNMITLQDSASEIIGKVMSWPDSMIVTGFELCTYMSDEELAQLKHEAESGLSDPREYKLTLAKEIARIYHTEEEVLKSTEDYINTFSKKEFPEAAQEISVPINSELGVVLVEHNIVASKNEFRRLVDEGGVTNMTTGEKITDALLQITELMDLKIGKRRFVKITLN